MRWVPGSAVQGAASDNGAVACADRPAAGAFAGVTLFPDLGRAAALDRLGQVFVPTIAAVAAIYADGTSAQTQPVQGGFAIVTPGIAEVSAITAIDPLAAPSYPSIPAVRRALARRLSTARGDPMTDATTNSTTSLVAADISVDEFHATASAIVREVGKVIVGQEAVVRQVLICVIAGGLALLEGVPGLGKTMLIRTLADVCGPQVRRASSSAGPDARRHRQAPTSWSESEYGRRMFRFEAGPIFANLLLADEIQPRTPKTQSPCSKRCRKRRSRSHTRNTRSRRRSFVLRRRTRWKWKAPTRAGAQLDRFLFKIDVMFPSPAELVEIMGRTTGAAAPHAGKVVSGAQIVAMATCGARCQIATHHERVHRPAGDRDPPDSATAPEVVRQYVRYGATRAWAGDGARREGQRAARRALQRGCMTTSRRSPGRRCATGSSSTSRDRRKGSRLTP